VSCGGRAKCCIKAGVFPPDTLGAGQLVRFCIPPPPPHLEHLSLPPNTPSWLFYLSLSHLSRCPFPVLAHFHKIWFPQYYCWIKPRADIKYEWYINKTARGMKLKRQLNLSKATRAMKKLNITNKSNGMYYTVLKRLSVILRHFAISQIVGNSLIFSQW
jgi:hypothetical protein